MAWLEKHLNHGNVPLEASANVVLGNYRFAFSETQNARIHAIGISIGGPEFAADEYGYLYLWNDAEHFTFMLPCAKGADRRLYVAIPDSDLIVPPGNNYCHRWWFNKLTAPRSIFADICYTLEPV